MLIHIDLVLLFHSVFVVIPCADSSIDKLIYQVVFSKTDIDNP